MATRVASFANLSYAVPAGGGVITAWQTKTLGNPGTIKLKVFRPTGLLGQYLSVGEEGPHAVAANTAPTFSGVRIPVQAGDLLGMLGVGLNCTSEYMPTKLGYKVQVFPMGVDPAPGSTASVESNGSGSAIEIAATVEPDVDGDGYGDETQDACPADASAHKLPCPPPATKPEPAPATPAPPAPPRDTVPPALKLSSKARQAALKAKAVVASATADEAVAFKATGSVSVPGAGAFSLNPASAPGAAGTKVGMALRIPKAARAKIGKALKEGKIVRASVHVIATDAAGNSSNASQSVTIVSPPKKAG
ncbi:MAG TPA: hypothetical protein VHA54_07190 [Solirubrobacterales bacterium]|nr:hypothetical protein [Solirubrobacterales bacterium]